jgi:acyl-CoA synthetase (AMP-forming)/AMP-acid ligase II
MINRTNDIDYLQISRILCLPMFHAAAAPASHITALRSGQVSYVMRRFELEPFLQNAQKYCITDLVVVPPLVIAMIMSPVSRKYSLKSVKHVSIGAAPLSKEAQQKLKDDLLTPGTLCNQVWGMTETSCIATQFYYPERDDTGSVGRPVPNLDVKLVDEAGKDITAYNVPGEMCVRGPTVIKGYFNNPSANAESYDAEGYLKTGDIMYCDSKTKKWYIIDRKKELIKVRGFQVAPPELEAVLLTHPQIVDTAVIGVSMRVPGEYSRAFADAEAEYPRAYVVRRPGAEGAKLTAEEVKEFTAKRLAGYKKLVGGVAFVDAIPKNASGKILKRILRERAKAELGLERAKI